MAKKNIDPANPQAGPVEPAPPPEVKPYAPERIAVAREEAQAKSEQVLAYSPTAVTTDKAPTGTVLALNA